ncbi:UNVERIFIED_CONTAM: hypothetical protein PYX00_011525 [Menopon gallinae]|uniref:PIN domain-containing protein n=1 Tax=Menopon gallinae TaxID=328185 RepID=A0AAW2H7V0_9NEOP
MPKHKKKDVAPQEEPVEILDYTQSEAFRINHTLTPPYSVIIDTNFINSCIRKKLDLHVELLNCLLANTTLFVTECVIGELEKLGRVYRVALALVKDKEFRRLECDHRGTYADDCILRRVRVNRCYIVATCDTGLKQRIRKIQGVPLLSIHGKKFVVERLPSN